MSKNYGYIFFNFYIMYVIRITELYLLCKIFDTNIKYYEMKIISLTSSMSVNYCNYYKIVVTG